MFTTYLPVFLAITIVSYNLNLNLSDSTGKSIKVVISCDGNKVIDMSDSKLWLAPDAYFDVPSLLSMRTSDDKYGVNAFALQVGVPSSGLLLFANYMS